MATRTLGPRPMAGTSQQPEYDGHVIQNAMLLDSPKEEMEAILSVAKFVPLPLRFLVDEAGRESAYGYFINSGLVSLINVSNGNKSVEVGVVGMEGFIGSHLVPGYRTSPTRAFMQIQGDGFRVTAEDLEAMLPQTPVLLKSLLRFSQQLGFQATIVAACNRLHDVERRMARWLLMSQDRTKKNVVPLTHEFLSHMLGTRRASVTEAAGKLQEKGLIVYSRGKLIVRNRAKLERASCSCYKQYNRQMQKWEAESK